MILGVTSGLLVLFLGGTSFGASPPRGHSTGDDCCDACGVEATELAAKIRELECSARWRTRDNAAHALRRFEWRCHPEVVDALVQAMLTDCHEEVREEAAESLAKLEPAPCVGQAHAALMQAARCDSDHATRKWARRALARMDDVCRDDCSVCAPSVAVPHEPPLVWPGETWEPSRFEAPVTPPPPTDSLPRNRTLPSPTIPPATEPEIRPPAPPSDGPLFDLPPLSDEVPVDRLSRRTPAPPRAQLGTRPAPSRRGVLGLLRRTAG